jgi:DNA modification methylase
MNVLSKLSDIAAGALEKWEHGTIPSNLWFEAVMDRYEGVRGDAADEPGRIIRGDNMRVAKTLFAAISAGTQDAPTLIYMDPPVFTRTSFSQNVSIDDAGRGDITLPVRAFSDAWRGAGSEYGEDRADAFGLYLAMISERITAARDLLSPEGSLWIHLDHHAVHYVKILADHIFGGPEHMLNEVIWQYSSGGATKKRFARKHDTLLFYAKEPERHRFYPMKEKSYNRERKPYHFKGVKEYRDEGGWYTLVNMRDVWRIDMVGRTSKERTGYATQKPEALIERVVSSCTERGDLCLDMFGGSGTLAVVCERMGRRWITIDESPLASLHAERRIAGKGAPFEIMSGTHTVAESPATGLMVQGAESWGLNVGIEGDAERGTAVVIVKPVSYVIPEGSLDVGPEDAAAVAEKARRSPGSFAAGMSAEIRQASDDGPFRPQCAVYGKDELRLPLRAAETRPKACEDSDACGPDARIIVRVVDIFGDVEVAELRLSKGKDGEV